MNFELSQVVIKMNSEINQIMERNLFPYFETIRIIETLLKQLPEFKRLEQENADLKKRLSLCLELSNLEINNQADLELSNQEIQNDIRIDKPAQVSVPVPVKNEIKLEIVETQDSTHPIVSEDELYKTVNLSNRVDNKLQTVEDTSEADEEVETSASEAEEEVEEEGEEEIETSASEEEEEDEEEEDEEESGGEGENPPEEGGVGENPPEENPSDEEVFMIEIKGKGNFYTTNETNGDIYQIEGEDDVGDIVGKFVNKVAIFN